MLTKSKNIMKKWIDLLETYHNAFRVLDYVIACGGFLFIVVAATISQGFPKGFIVGLVIGSLFVLVNWLIFRTSYNRAVEAREKLAAYSQGHTEVFNTSKQVTYAVTGSIIIGLLGLLLLGSCLIYSCKTDLIRPRLLFLLIGVSIAVQQLFWKERVKGKAAIIALGMLVVLVVFLIGKIFSVW